MYTIIRKNAKLRHEGSICKEHPLIESVRTWKETPTTGFYLKGATEISNPNGKNWDVLGIFYSNSFNYDNSLKSTTIHIWERKRRRNMT